MVTHQQSTSTSKLQSFDFKSSNLHILSHGQPFLYPAVAVPLLEGMPNATSENRVEGMSDAKGENALAKKRCHFVESNGSVSLVFFLKFFNMDTLTELCCSTSTPLPLMMRSHFRFGALSQLD